MIESDATRGGCGRGEFLDFVGERLYVSAYQTNELAEHLIVSRDFQLFQPRLRPRLCLSIFQRRELDDSTSLKQHLTRLLTLVEVVGNENHYCRW